VPRKSFAPSRLFFLLPLCVPAFMSAQPLASAPKPPLARSEPVTTDHFGSKVTDPYQWMDTATSSNPQFMAFLKSQNDYTQATLAAIPGRDALLARIHQLGNAVASVGGWQRAGGNIFYLQTNPGASTASLRVRDKSGKTRTLLDPVSLEQNGSHAAINYFVPSWNGADVVVAVSLGGSEDTTIHVVESSSGKMLPDVITRTQYAGPSWSADSKSFFYARLQKLAPGAPPDAVYENERVYLHVLGADPEKDAAVFGPGVPSSPAIPKAGFTGVSITPGSKYALAFYSAGTTDPGELYIAPVEKAADPHASWTKIVSAKDMVATGADSNTAAIGSTLFLLIEKDAPNRKLISIDLDHPDIQNATVIVPPSDAVLLGIYAAKDGLYLTSKQGVGFDLRRASYISPTKWEKVPLPYVATISAVDASVLEPGVLFGLDTWTRSYQAFLYFPEAGRVSNIGLVPPNPADFSNVEAREVKAISADGTEVPLSIICRKDIVLDGSHPVLYEGYGAYGVSIDPSFSVSTLAWIEHGGVEAYIHVRGGGELGEAWHNAGRKETKQHTIDDMVAAANYLIQQKYTSPAHLAVLGTSAGGIAVGGALVQHPELFVAAIDNVGATDLLSFQKSQGGAANIPEFGDVTDPAGFKYLYAVSPYHHVVDNVHYPAVLAITGVNDPRVPSWIVAKMVARLQAANSGPKPILLRVDFDAGHGIGSSRPQREQLRADILSFILWQSGDPAFQPTTSAPQ
jgi:prolyl oligopeptidase